MRQSVRTFPSLDVSKFAQDVLMRLKIGKPFTVLYSFVCSAVWFSIARRLRCTFGVVLRCDLFLYSRWFIFSLLSVNRDSCNLRDCNWGMWTC